MTAKPFAASKKLLMGAVEEKLSVVICLELSTEVQRRWLVFRWNVGIATSRASAAPAILCIYNPLETVHGPVSNAGRRFPDASQSRFSGKRLGVKLMKL